MSDEVNTAAQISAALAQEPAPATHSREWFRQQIDDSRRESETWPGWMKEARRVATASFPVTATPRDHAAAIASARLEEREECAKLCDSLAFVGQDENADFLAGIEACARAIRARTKDQT